MGFIFNPTYLNPSKKDYTVTSRRGDGLMQSTRAADETVACNDYELMVSIEKGTSPFDDSTFARSTAKPRDTLVPAHCKRTSRHSETSVASTKNEEPDDDEAAVLGQQNNQLQPPQETLRRHSMPSNGCLAANLPSRLSSISSATVAAQFQQADQAAQAAPGTPVPTPLPSPCHIFVKKSMVVEYKTTPQVAATNSSLSATPMHTGSQHLAASTAVSSETANLRHGNTENSMASTSPGAMERAVFHGDHSVQITGPGSGRTDCQH